jgi:hypothetical protein
MSHRILSIDAWVGAEQGQWDWNQWWNVGTIDTIPKTNTEIIQWFIDNEYLKPKALDLVYVEDDQYNLVIRAKKDDCPLWAIEYGNSI